MAEKGQVIIIGSNLNYAPKHAVTWTADRFRVALVLAGFAGMEYMPIRSRLGWQILRGGDMNGLVVATHQTFREEEGLAIVTKAAGRLPNAKAAALQLAMDTDVVPMSKSDAAAAKAQSTLETKVPHVVHPYGQLLGDRLDLNSRRSLNPRRDYHELARSGVVGELQYQPTAEWAQYQGVLSHHPQQTAEDMTEVAHNNGIKRAAVDINHLLAVRHGEQFSDPVAIAGHLAAMGELGALEFSVQSHLGGAAGALKNMLDNGIEGTPHGDVVAEVARNTPPGEDLVLKMQIPAREFTALGMNYQEGHGLLVDQLGRFAVSYLPVAN